MNIRMYVDNWTYEDFCRFLVAAQSGNMADQYKLAEKLLIGWSYDVPFEEGLMALGMIESAEVLRTVFETLQSIADALDTSDVVVDFKPWTTRRFLEFNEAREAHNHRRVERMVHEVTKLEGVNPDEPLKFQDGAKMMKAITEQYKKLITGKN